MTKTQANTVVIYTDGACKGNPGPGGWGARLEFGEKSKEIYGGEHNTTNNRMELMAAIKALNALKRPVKIAMHTDSNYVKQGIESWIKNWKKNNWRNSKKEPVKNKDLWQALDSALGDHEVSWHWIKGHSGHPGNERADELANLGVESIQDSGNE